MNQEVLMNQSGALMAAADVLRALIATHPSYDEFLKHCRQETETTSAKLLAMSQSDASIDGYNTFLALVLGPDTP